MKFLLTKTSISSYKPIEFESLEQFVEWIPEDGVVVSKGIGSYTHCKDKDGAVGTIEIYDDYRE